MPWLALLLALVWLLDRLGLLRSRPRTTSTSASDTPATETPTARQAASAWSSYVPRDDVTDPYDDIPDRSNGEVSDADGVPERAYEAPIVDAADPIVDPADQPRVDPTNQPEDHD